MSIEINQAPLIRVIKHIKLRKRSTYPLKIVHSDAFPDSRLVRSEDNDCTVRALAIAGEMSYDVAHEMLAVKCGRKPKHGTPFINLLGAKAETGIIVGNYFVRWHKVERKWNWTGDPYARQKVSGTTVRELIASGQLTARSVISIDKHVMACIDGVVHDTFNAGARSIVQGWYSFEKVWQ